MSTKKELKLLTELLNLEGVNVYSHRQYEGIGIILQIEAIDRESICGRCGSKSNNPHSALQLLRHVLVTKTRQFSDTTNRNSLTAAT